MTYAIAGVSGHTGAVAAHTLLDREARVRVVVRDADKGKPFAARGAEVAIADLGDAEALARAFAGVKGAFVLVPPNMVVPDFRAYQRKIVDAIARAAETAKLPHLVLLSSIGAQHPSGTGPIAGLHEAETRLRALPITKSTFVRASSFIENLGSSLATLGQGFVASFLPADFRYDMIATRDIGVLVADVLLEGAKETTAIELGGPAYSMRDAAGALTELTGKPIRVQEAPLTAVAPTFQGFGMSADLAALYQELIGGISTGRVAWEGGHRRLQGTTTLKAVLAEMIAR
jgi:uncharacterized protein YbjT (DUF2867 family)